MSSNTDFNNLGNTEPLTQEANIRERRQTISLEFNQRAMAKEVDFPQEYLIFVKEQEGTPEGYFFKGVAVPLVDLSEKFRSLLIMSEKLNQAYSKFENSMTQTGISVNDTVRADKIKSFLAVQAADWYRGLYPSETSITIENDEIGRWLFEKLLANFKFDNDTDQLLAASLVTLYKKYPPYDIYSREHAIQTSQQLIDAIYLTHGGQILHVDLRKSFRHIIKTALTQTYQSSDLDTKIYVYVGKILVKRFASFGRSFTTISEILKRISGSHEDFKIDLRQNGVSADKISKNSVKIFMEAQTKIWLRITAPYVHYRLRSTAEQWNMQYGWFTRWLMSHPVNSNEQLLINKLLDILEKKNHYQNHSARNALLEMHALTEHMHFRRDLNSELYGHITMVLIEKILSNYMPSELEGLVAEFDRMTAELENASEMKRIISEIKGIGSKISPIPFDI